MDVNKPMNDLDMLYDWYRDCNFASTAYAGLALRVKDDRVEELLRDLTDWALMGGKETAKVIISLGGKIY